MQSHKSVKENRAFSNKTAPPYHLFKCAGTNFVYDTTGCRFYKIEERMADFLDICLKYPWNEAVTIWHTMMQNTMPINLIDDLINTVKTLSGLGLFDVPPHSIALSAAALDKEMQECDNYPLKGIELCLTNSCNLACKYCFCEVGRNRSHSGTMSREVAVRAIDMLFANAGPVKKVNVVFFGGEPLLNRELLYDALEYANAKGAAEGKKVTFGMTTNATLIDDEFADFAARNHIGMMVSLDGPQRHHDNQCPTKTGKGSYQAAIEGIKRLLERKIPVDIRATVASPATPLKELLECYNDLGQFRQIIIEPAKNCIETPSPVDISEEEFCRLMLEEESELPALAETIICNKGKMPPYFPYHACWNAIESTLRHAPYYVCAAGMLRCYVDTDGTLYPCALLSGPKSWQIGNVAHGIDRPKSRKFWLDYKTSIEKNCAKCWAYSICRPSMPCDVIKSDRTFHATHRFCRLKKIKIERAAYLYLRYQEAVRNNQ